MQRIKNKKIIFSVGLVMIALMAVVIAILPFLAKKRAAALRKSLLHELRTTTADFDENSVALNCDYATAQKIAAKTGGTLNMTERDSVGSISLESKTIYDVLYDDTVGGYLSYITPDYELYPDSTSFASLSDALAVQNDKYLYSRIGMEKDGQNVRNITKGNVKKKSRVVVIDTGVQYDHEEFLDSNGNTRISPLSYSVGDGKTAAQGGYDIIADGDTSTPGHGTLVTGIIFAQGDNGIGIAGLAEDVELIMIKMPLNSNGGYSYSDFLKALDYAITLKPDVVNMSLGAYDTPNYYASRLKTLKANGAVLVAAAGNTKQSNVHYPAADPNVIGVGAFDSLFYYSDSNTQYAAASYSSFGDVNVDICAPGKFYSTKVKGYPTSYGVYSGTSFASPVVAAAVALYTSLYPDDTPDQTISKLYASADDQGDKGKDYIYGYGGLNVWDFLFGESCTVTFNDGTDSVESESFVAGKTLQVYPFPESAPSGKVFDGWYLDQACTKPVTYYREVFANGATVYAKWSDSPSDNSFDYTFDTNGYVIVKGYYGGNKELFLSKKLQVAGGEYTVKGIAAKSFYSSNLTKIVLPEGVESVGEYAFYGMSFEYLYLPSSLTSVGNYIVASSTGRLYLQNTPSGYSSSWNSNTKMTTYTGAGNFVLSDGMELIGTETYTLLGYGGGAKELTLTADLPITAVYGGALAGTQLNVVNMPNVTAIGAGAFQNSAVKQVSMPAVQAIGANAFDGCPLLYSVAFPSSLTEIGESAFKNCTGLYSVDFSSATALSSIGDNAFDGCEKLQSVDLSGATSLSSIGRESFKDCKNLFLAYIPDNVKTVDYNAFGGCDSLKELRLPFVGRTAGGTTSNHFGYIFGTSNVQYQKSVVPASLRYVYVGESEVASSAFDSLSGISFFLAGKYAGSNADCTIYTAGGYSVLYFYADGTLCGMYGGKTGATVENTSEGYFVPVGVSITSTSSDLPATFTDTTVHLQTKATTCSVTFRNENGVVLSQKDYAFGAIVEEPAAPARSATVEYEYVFSGWDQAVSVADGDKTYTATFSAVKRKYTVTFLDSDGSVIAQTQTAYGDVPPMPVVQDKIIDDEYYNSFDGWDKEVVAVSGDAGYTATYRQLKRQYTVTFAYEDGTAFYTQTYEYGSEITPPDTARESDGVYTYTFSSWQTAFAPVTGTATYVALYDKTYIEYTVTFVDHDGREISRATYHYGDSVTVPSDPAREATEDCAYVFSGWSPAVGKVSGNATYTATYTERSLLYTITFTNYDGSVWSSAQYHEGDTVVLPQDTPKRTVNSKSYYYLFIGWGNVLPVSGDATYTAQYERTLYEYTVTFVDHDGRKISEEIYHYNDTVALPEEPTREGYTFIGWSPAVGKVSGDTTYTATYSLGVSSAEENFRSAVAAVQSLQDVQGSSLSARLSAIAAALTAYEKVGDKSAVSEEYAALQTAIGQYNADVQALNGAAEQAESDALALFSSGVAAVASLTAAAFVLRCIFKGRM